MMNLTGDVDLHILMLPTALRAPAVQEKMTVNVL